MFHKTHEQAQAAEIAKAEREFHKTEQLRAAGKERAAEKHEERAVMHQAAAGYHATFVDPATHATTPVTTTPSTLGTTTYAEAPRAGYQTGFVPPTTGTTAVVAGRHPTTGAEVFDSDRSLMTSTTHGAPVGSYQTGYQNPVTTTLTKETLGGTGNNTYTEYPAGAPPAGYNAGFVPPTTGTTTVVAGHHPTTGAEVFDIDRSLMTSTTHGAPVGSYHTGNTTTTVFKETLGGTGNATFAEYPAGSPHTGYNAGFVPPTTGTTVVAGHPTTGANVLDSNRSLMPSTTHGAPIGGYHTGNTTTTVIKETLGGTGNATFAEYPAGAPPAGYNAGFVPPTTGTTTVVAGHHPITGTNVLDTNRYMTTSTTHGAPVGGYHTGDVTEETLGTTGYHTVTIPSTPTPIDPTIGAYPQTITTPVGVVTPVSGRDPLGSASHYPPSAVGTGAIVPGKGERWTDVVHERHLVGGGTRSYGTTDTPVTTYTTSAPTLGDAAIPISGRDPIGRAAGYPASGVGTGAPVPVKGEKWTTVVHRAPVATGTYPSSRIDTEATLPPSSAK